MNSGKPGPGKPNREKDKQRQDQIRRQMRFSVSYLLTGDIAIAGAITLVEPVVNTIAHYFFDRWWGHPALKARWARWADAWRRNPPRIRAAS